MLKYTVVTAIAACVLAGAYLLFRELQTARADLAELKPGYIDVSFSQSMSLHHQQAIAMAQLMLDGRPTGLRSLARNIASAQLVELGEMRGWLRLWNEPLTPTSLDMTWMLMGKKNLREEYQQYVIDCGRSSTGMLGLASNTELNQLRVLEGRARDEYFLKLMLAHHQGGVPMAQFAAEEASLQVVRAIAGRIVLDQSREIQQIQSMLALAASDSEYTSSYPISQIQ